MRVAVLLLEALVAVLLAVLVVAAGWSLHRLAHTAPLALPVVAVPCGALLRVAREWSPIGWVWGWRSAIRRRIDERQP